MSQNFPLLALETWHTILWLVAGYATRPISPVRFTSISLVEGHWSVRLSILATALTVAATEGFYAWRAYLLGSTCLARYLKWLVIPTVVLLLVCKGFALAAGIEAFSETRTIAGFQHLSWLVAASYGLASATDVTMAVTMVFLLRRTRIGLRRSDTLLDVLIKYTISTGILTSIVGTKLYANSVLAFLNSRVSLRRRLDGFVDTTSFIDLSPLPQDVLLQDQHRDGSNADGPSVTDGCAPRVSSCSCDTCQTSLCFHASD
ncbi:hypothetical protein GY45DRAFT_104964 [Cubamyces sp. BRFM 1775]|nr:hypothetical protein GY45DRAFT_104964 [Cubamyces sp. BRFM 1775]